MKTPGVAVVGTGYIGEVHIQTIAAHPNAQLQVICSTPRSEERARQLQKTHNALRTTTHFDDVLTDDHVDVVYLCTPNSQHASQAVATALQQPRSSVHGRKGDPSSICFCFT